MIYSVESLGFTSTVILSPAQDPRSGTLHLKIIEATVLGFRVRSRVPFQTRTQRHASPVPNVTDSILDSPC